MLSNDVQEQYEIHERLRADIAELRQRVAKVEASAEPAEHEPQLYAVTDGRMVSSADGTWTIAYLGCSCGWNKDGKAGEKQKWSDHLTAGQRAKAD